MPPYSVEPAAEQDQVMQRTAEPIEPPHDELIAAAVKRGKLDTDTSRVSTVSGDCRGIPHARLENRYGVTPIVGSNPTPPRL